MKTCERLDIRRTLYILVLVSSAALVGCSSKPSAGQGQQAVLERINAESEGRIALTRFEKVNGVEGEVAGTKTYALEFELEIKFLEDCKWSTGLIAGDGGMSFHTSKKAANPNSPLGLMENVMNGPGTEVNAGQRFRLSGSIHYLKKERGWSVDRVDLMKANSIGASNDTPRAGTPEPRGRSFDGPSADQAQSFLSKSFESELEAPSEPMLWKFRHFQETGASRDHVNGQYNFRFTAQLQRSFKDKYFQTNYLENLRQSTLSGSEDEKRLLVLLRDGKEDTTGIIVFRKNQTGWEPLGPLMLAASDLPPTAEFAETLHQFGSILFGELACFVGQAV